MIIPDVNPKPPAKDPPPFWQNEDPDEYEDC